MFIRWYKKGGKVHRIDNVVTVDVVSTGDVNFHWLCKGKIITDTLVKGSQFDFVNIQDKEREE